MYGFEPFLGLAENPSEQVVRALDGKTLGGSGITGPVLPVE